MPCIVDTADELWLLLKKEGPMSIDAITNKVNKPRITVLMCLGWLDSEDKLKRTQTKHGMLLSVR